jgi:hypothetical protein
MTKHDWLHSTSFIQTKCIHTTDLICISELAIKMKDWSNFRDTGTCEIMLHYILSKHTKWKLCCIQLDICVLTYFVHQTETTIHNLYTTSVYCWENFFDFTLFVPLAEQQCQQCRLMQKVVFQRWLSVLCR